jgi:bla regulator protein BlaR1
MNPASLSPIADHLWQSTLFAGAAGLLTLAVRKNHARVRHGLWMAASIKFLVPFAMLVALGSQIGWRNTVVPTQSNLLFVMGEVGQPFTAPVGSFTAPARAVNPLPGVLLGIWAVGFAGIALSWWVRWRRIRVAVRRGSALDLETPIRAVSCRTVLEPGVFGIFRPVLLLPDGIADRLSPAQLNVVIAHELCHVRHRDNLAAAFQMFVETVFWFHPMVWWIGKRMVEERELACDEEVLRLCGEPRIYAEAILNVCKLYQESPLVCVSGVTGSNLKTRIEAIMMHRLSKKLNFGGQLLLVMAGLLAVLGPVLIGVVNPTRLAAQPPQSGARPAFAVASIKPSKSADRRPMFNFQEGGGLVADNFTVKKLIEVAYGIKHFQISGGPSWMSSELYSITAKPESATEYSQALLMLQSLLAERFQLVIRRESKEMPIYGLVAAKSGPKFKEVSESDPDMVEVAKRPDVMAGGRRPRINIIRRGRLTIQGADMTMLAADLSNFLGRMVLDKTGLSGMYDLRLEWTPDEDQVGMFQAMGVPEGFGAPPPDWHGPTLFSALEEQLGLRLDSQKGPVEMLVVERVERPSVN